jgi:hypothetical protein
MTELRRKQLVLTTCALTLGACLGVAACGDEFVGSNPAVTGGAAGMAHDAHGGEPTSPGASGEGGAGLPRANDGGASSAGEPGSGGAGEAGSAGMPPEASGYARDVLGEQPIAYWRMGSAMQEVVADASGHGNDLVLQGGGHTLNVPGAVDADGAIGFDGETSFAIATDPRALDFVANAPFTLECWARRSAGGSSYFQHLLSNVDGVAGNRHGYALYLLPAPETGDNPRSVFEYDRPAADLGLWGEVAEESTWGHYVAVFDGAQATFYVNGTLSDSKPVDGAFITRTGPFSVARVSSASGSFFKGALDEIAIYPRAFGAKVAARHFAFHK